MSKLLKLIVENAWIKYFGALHLFPTPKGLNPIKIYGALHLEKAPSADGAIIFIDNRSYKRNGRCSPELRGRRTGNISANRLGLYSSVGSL